MPQHPTHALDSLDAWPGEAARPPLRLLEVRHPAPRVAASPPARSPLAGRGWLQRVRQVLSGR